MTPMTILLEALVVGGGLLFVVELSLSGRLWGAAALGALTLAGALVAWKIQLLSISMRKMEMSLDSDRFSTPPRTRAGNEASARLRHIGTFVPKRGGTAQSGRSAAAVNVDPVAPFRLVAATQRESDSGVHGRTLAMVGSGGLASVLAAHGTVRRIHPSMSIAEIAKHDPQVLVIEEDALSDGPWRGVLEPQGSQMLVELREAMDAVLALEGSVYTLASSGQRGLASEAVRTRATVIHPYTSAADGPESLLRDLTLYHSGARRES